MICCCCGAGYKTCPYSILLCSDTTSWQSSNKVLQAGASSYGVSGKGYGIESRGTLNSYVSPAAQATRQAYWGSNTILALGMADTSIHANQLTQVGGRTGRTAINVRLDDAKSLPWAPNVVGGASYVTVDLGFPYRIYSVGTQGDPHDNHWLKGFRVEHAISGTSFSTAQTFTSVNSDSNTTVYNHFTTPIVARLVRIIPTEIEGLGSFRFELYGRPENRTVGISEFQVPDSAFSAEGGTAPQNARLGLPVNGWYGTGTAAYLTVRCFACSCFSFSLSFFLSFFFVSAFLYLLSRPLFRFTFAIHLIIF